MNDSLNMITKSRNKILNKSLQKSGGGGGGGSASTKRNNNLRDGDSINGEIGSTKLGSSTTKMNFNPFHSLPNKQLSIR